jgi:hypothetical protein
MATRKRTTIAAGAAAGTADDDLPFEVSTADTAPTEVPAFYDLTRANAPAVLSVAERAERALVIKQTEAELAELAAATVDIVEITNDDGREQVHRAQITLRDTRLDIERLGKAAREDANKFLQAVIARQDKLIGIVSPEEERLKAMKVAYDRRIADEKAAIAAAEKKRVDDLVARVEAIKNIPLEYAQCDSKDIADAIDRVCSAQITELEFAEFTEGALLAKANTVAKLKELGEAAFYREQAAAQAEADRAELARLKAEAAERERAEKEAAAERARIDAIITSRRESIAAFRRQLDMAIVDDTMAAELARRIARVEAMTVDAESYGDLETEAREAKVAALMPLRVMHAKAVQSETERAEVAKMRREIEDRNAEEARIKAAMVKATTAPTPAAPLVSYRQVDLEEAISEIDKGGLISGTPPAPIVDTASGEILTGAPVTCPECGHVFRMQR